MDINAGGDRCRPTAIQVGAVAYSRGIGGIGRDHDAALCHLSYLGKIAD